MKHTNKLIITLSVILTIILCLTLVSCNDSENESVSTDDTKSENTSAIQTTKNSEVDSAEETTVNSETDSTEETTETFETENNEPYEIKVDDYTLIKNENGCYLSFDDISKYQNNSSNGSMVASEITFKSIKEFKDTVTKGLLEDWQKQVVASFSNNGADILTCDFNNLYEPTLPQESNVAKVYWNGDTYAYLVMMIDESFGFVQHHTKESYDKMYSYEYEQYFNRNTVTVIRVEESDGKEITYYKTSTGVSLHKERYTLTNGNITVQVDRNYYSSDDTLRGITLYCSEGNLYYTVTLYSLKEDPTDEWLLQFGLKRYVENDHEVM